MSEDPAEETLAQMPGVRHRPVPGRRAAVHVKHRTRLERAEQLRSPPALAQGQPLRQVATDLGVARSTLRGWCAAVPLAGLPPEVAACLATPAGRAGCIGWWW